MNDLKSELSGNLEDCLLALLEPSSLYDAKCLRRAMRVRQHLQYVMTCIDILSFCMHNTISVNVLTFVLFIIFQGAGTDEETLIDILCTRTNQVCCYMYNKVYWAIIKA